MNAMKDPAIDLQLFEMSVSSPFGVRHVENQRFDRLLTTFCDPGKGMDATIRLWGYKSERYDVQTPKEAMDILKSKLRYNRAVLGPVDMGNMKYQQFPQLLKGMDHYVALEYWSEDKIMCHDSEGYCGYLIDYTELQECVSVEDLYEAEGKITIRFIFGREEEADKKDILESILKRVFLNLKAAEEEGQGAGAFVKCYDFIEGKDIYQWKLSLLYDIQYLIQRKWMMKEFACLYQEIFEEKREMCGEIKEIVEEQLKIAGELYNGLRLNNMIRREYFIKLGDQERRLNNL